MKYPKTAEEMMALLRSRYGEIEEMAELAAATGIRQNVLDSWQKRPQARLRSGGRAHYKRIFGEPLSQPTSAHAEPVSAPATAQSTDIAALVATQAALTSKIDALVAALGAKGVDALTSATPRHQHRKRAAAGRF